MATNKFTNILSDMLNNKLRCCYKKFMNKNDDQIPNIVYNLGYYPKEIRQLIEKRDQNSYEELTDLLIEELKKQSTPSLNDEVKTCYYEFKRNYGDPSSNSSLGRIYNNITTSYSYENGNTTRHLIKNDGWAFIQRLLSIAIQWECLPTSWVDCISILLNRAKFLHGRKASDLTEDELKISNKMFNTVTLKLKFDMDIFGPESYVWTWDYEGNIMRKLFSQSTSYYGVFGYHDFCGEEYINLSGAGNHYGVEWELDFKTRKNFIATIRALEKAGIMFNENHTAFRIIPMDDGSIRRHCGYGVEMIFAADTFNGIINTLEIAKGIFNKYDVKSSTEKNHCGIHVTQDFSYLKGNAFYKLAQYVNYDMPLSEYLQHAKRQPNEYCRRSSTGFDWIWDDNGNAVLNTDRSYDRYRALNVDNARTNRLEWRLFNSCCDPVECIKWIQALNDKFNLEAFTPIANANEGAN